MIEFITDNQAQFAALAAALMVVGGIIVKLTPTKTDDKWWTAIFGKRTE